RRRRDRRRDRRRRSGRLSRPTDPSDPRPTLLVLGDQLTRRVGPLAQAGPEDVRVLMVESRAILHGAPHHAQKLAVVLSAMRHFADDLRVDGYEVAYLRHDHPDAVDFASAAGADAARRGGGETWLVTPADHGVEAPIRTAVEDVGGRLRRLPNAQWATDDAFFDRWAEGRTRLRMEDFYREVRRATGVLMDADGGPVGGRFNFDADNREPPRGDLDPPDPPTFPPDAITREVLREVAEAFPDAWGEAEPFVWPVTRDDAQRALTSFCETRLRGFGAHQDAMVEDQPFLWHSLLSVPLNLGLLHPREVVDAAVAYGHDERRKVPLAALEGFVRQVLGWREFVHHVYRTRGPAMRSANALQADGPLPPAYWGAPTDLRCLSETVETLRRRGYTHHIQRLMVLGNIAMLAGTDPAAVLAWFTATHVDALDWVMVPNVLGMSQYADGGGMTTKPYAAGANYLNRMSDHCAACRFDPKARSGEDACPVTDLYWAFVDRHQERFAGNHRMRMIVASWRRRDAEARRDLLRRADRRIAALRAGRL
ncbi:MAG: cryptochrome/photolyase family protein, partial [Phycisphaerales bacterium JB060]